jgi:hypothetical protein
MNHLPKPNGDPMATGQDRLGDEGGQRYTITIAHAKRTAASSGVALCDSGGRPSIDSTAIALHTGLE